MNDNSLKYIVLDRCSYEEVYRFMSLVEKDFVPSLFQRIDVEAYIIKLLGVASINTCRLNDEIVGMIALYDNDLQTKEAYITFLAVNANLRGLHIAPQLLKLAADEAKKKGMTKVLVSTCNPMIVRFYQNNGYAAFKGKEINSSDLQRFYLVKDLL